MMIIVLLYLLAPVLQLITSILRVRGNLGIPIGAIMILSFIVGIVLSFQAMRLIPAPPQSGIRCGMAQGAVLMAGVALQMVSAPLIAVIAYAVFWFKKRNKQRMAKLGVT
jgi:hypothetical protein